MKKTYFTFGMLGLFGTLLIAMSCNQAPSNPPEINQQESSINEENVSIQVCPAPNLAQDEIEIGNENSGEYVDLNREIKDFGTKFVVKEFFTTQDTLFNFLKLVYETVDARLATYRKEHNIDERSAFFIFKGGNVLRLLANKFLSMLNPEARDLLKGQFGDKFLRSDADFSIFIDPDNLGGNDYEKTFEDIAKLAYDALGELRAEFVKNPEKYFNFLQTKSSVATTALNKYFDKLSDLESLKDPENSAWSGAQFAQFQLAGESADKSLQCPYTGQSDYLYKFDDDNDIIGEKITQSTSWISNTINKTLQWEIESLPGNKVVFWLVRAKVQFEYTFMKGGMITKRPIGGELIDISMPRKEDFRLKGFLGKQDSWLTTYTITHPDSGESVAMKAESMEGLSADIIEIVFKQFPRPWEAAKYEKRISRLFFLAMVDMVSTYGTGSAEVRAYLDGIRSKVIDSLKKLYPLKGEESLRIAEQTKKDAKELAEKVPNMKIAAEVFNSIAELEVNQLLSNPKDDDQENFGKFIDEVVKNIDIMYELSNMEPRKIELKEIYNADMDSLL